MSPRRKFRLLLYCHNAVGLGHIVRTSQVGEAAADRDDCECRIITGCRFIRRIRFDPRTPVEELTPVRVVEGGRITTVEGGDGMAVMEERGARIEEVARAWMPDVFLADHIALGLGGELVRTLTSARREGWPTRFVWGMRDVQLAPQYAVHMIRRPKNPVIRQALELYCGAIGYSDKDWIDPFEAYKDVLMPARLDYVGVVARPPLPPLEADAPTVVAMPGGGASGAQLFPLLVSALRPLLLGEGVRLRYVVGPYGSAASLAVPEELRGRVEIVPEGSAEETVRDASLVVSRVGYNTSYSLVQTDLPLVFVPTPTPGDEQIYRAGRLARLSNVWVVEETAAGAAELLRAAVRGGLAAGRAKRELPFRVDGARRTAAWLAALAATEACVS